LKYLLVVGDGMADYPIPELGYRTPLQVANTPNMDLLSRNGRLGLLRTIPEDLQPGSDTAHLTILGYDPHKYRAGRGALEAASRGISLFPKDVAFRCNLVTEDQGRLDDYSADQISTSEALELMESLEASIGRNEGIELYGGVGYRHLLVLRNAPLADQVHCVAPHHAQGKDVAEILPTPCVSEAKNAADQLTRIISASRRILKDHEINRTREGMGKKPANMIWPWGPGKKSILPSFEAIHGIKGSTISAIDLIKGIARLISMKVIDVPGATGYPDTNYENKADYALRELRNNELVLVHVEAPDEASHEGNCDLKIKAIEDLDSRLLGRILDRSENETVVSVLPDHYTSLEVMKHTKDPVPFLVYSPNQRADHVSSFDEVSAEKGGLGLLEGNRLIPLMLGVGKNTS